jgi:L-rhamnonate dehydratase
MKTSTQPTRRTVLRAAAAAALGTRLAWAKDMPSDVKITRIVCFDLVCRRNKYVGKNSRRDDHGIEASDRMLRVYTDAGFEGIGTTRDTKENCQAILGKRLSDFYHPDDRRMVGPFARSTSPFWDLAGQVLKKPVYELLGGSVRPSVPAYDGSIYFVDLIKEHEKDWEDELKHQLDLGMQMGHAAFKVKVGRGSKWMPRDEGDRRDIKVLGIIRNYVGSKTLLAIDANDGYDVPRAKRFLRQIAGLNIDWIEEIVPVKYDRSPEYTDLKTFLRENRWHMKIADGENAKAPEDFTHWIQSKAVDILQGDMNVFGFEDTLVEARMAEPAGIVIAPHNWGSLVGYYMQLHVGKAVKNFYRAEMDPMSSPALIAEGYGLKAGVATVPEAPGLGLKIDEKRFADHTKVQFDIKL